MRMSPGLKRGGVLNIVRHDIEVTCPYDKIPAFFEVDLTGLEIGRSIHISAIKLPDGVEPTIKGRDFTIATIAGAVKQDETDTATEAAAAAATAEASAAAAPGAEAKPGEKGAAPAAKGAAPAAKGGAPAAKGGDAKGGDKKK